MCTVSMLVKAAIIICTVERLEDRDVALQVVVADLDVRLREEAENLGQQCAFVIGHTSDAQSFRSAPSGTSSPIQWVCCWRFQNS